MQGLTDLANGFVVAFYCRSGQTLSQGSNVLSVSFNVSRRNIVTPMSYCSSHVIDAGEMRPALRGDAAQISSQMKVTVYPGYRGRILLRRLVSGCLFMSPYLSGKTR